MKDAKGHGSDPRGAHAEGVNQIGKPAPIQFDVNAYHYDTAADSRTPMMVRINSRTPETKEEAQAIASQYPKSTRMQGSTLTEVGGNVRGYVSMGANFQPDKTTGALNETGVKRYATFLKTAEKLGHTVNWAADNHSSNVYKDQDEFHRKIGLKK